MGVENVLRLDVNEKFRENIKDSRGTRIVLYKCISIKLPHGPLVPVRRSQTLFTRIWYSSYLLKIYLLLFYFNFKIFINPDWSRRSWINFSSHIVDTMERKEEAKHQKTRAFAVRRIRVKISSFFFLCWRHFFELTFRGTK